MNLEPGRSFTTAGRTICEADIVAFAGISGDFNGLHTNAEHARNGPFGQRVAHGLLVLSVISGLTTQSDKYREIESRLLGLLDISCRFLKPTFIGDTIRVRVSVIDVLPTRKPGRCISTLRREGVNQREEVVIQADFKMLVLAPDAA